MEIYLQRMIYSNNDLERMEKILNDEELANQTNVLKELGFDIGNLL